MLQDVKNLLSTALVVVSTLYLEARMSGESGFAWFEPVMVVLVLALLVVYSLGWRRIKKEQRAKKLSALLTQAWFSLKDARQARPPHFLFDEAVYRYMLFTNHETRNTAFPVARLVPVGTEALQSFFPPRPA